MFCFDEIFLQTITTFELVKAFRNIGEYVTDLSRSNNTL